MGDRNYFGPPAEVGAADTGDRSIRGLTIGAPQTAVGGNQNTAGIIGMISGPAPTGSSMQGSAPAYARFTSGTLDPAAMQQQGGPRGPRPPGGGGGGMRGPRPPGGPPMFNTGSVRAPRQQFVPRAPRPSLPPPPKRDMMSARATPNLPPPPRRPADRAGGMGLESLGSRQQPPSPPPPQQEQQEDDDEFLDARARARARAVAMRQGEALSSSSDEEEPAPAPASTIKVKSEPGSASDDLLAKLAGSGLLSSGADEPPEKKSRTKPGIKVKQEKMEGNGKPKFDSSLRAALAKTLGATALVDSAEVAEEDEPEQTEEERAKIEKDRNAERLEAEEREREEELELQRAMNDLVDVKPDIKKLKEANKVKREKMDSGYGDAGSSDTYVGKMKIKGEKFSDEELAEQARLAREAAAAARAKMDAAQPLGLGEEDDEMDWNGLGGGESKTAGLIDSLTSASALENNEEAELLNKERAELDDAKPGGGGEWDKKMDSLLGLGDDDDDDGGDDGGDDDDGGDLDKKLAGLLGLDEDDEDDGDDTQTKASRPEKPSRSSLCKKGTKFRSPGQLRLLLTRMKRRDYVRTAPNLKLYRIMLNPPDLTMKKLTMEEIVFWTKNQSDPFAPQRSESEYKGLGLEVGLDNTADSIRYRQKKELRMKQLAMRKKLEAKAASMGGGLSSYSGPKLNMKGHRDADLPSNLKYANRKFGFSKLPSFKKKAPGDSPQRESSPANYVERSVSKDSSESGHQRGYVRPGMSRGGYDRGLAAKPAQGSRYGQGIRPGAGPSKFNPNLNRMPADSTTAAPSAASLMNKMPDASASSSYPPQTPDSYNSSTSSSSMNRPRGPRTPPMAGGGRGEDGSNGKSDAKSPSQLLKIIRMLLSDSSSALNTDPSKNEKAKALIPVLEDLELIEQADPSSLSAEMLDPIAEFTMEALASSQ